MSIVWPDSLIAECERLGAALAEARAQLITAADRICTKCGDGLGDDAMCGNCTHPMRVDRAQLATVTRERDETMEKLRALITVDQKQLEMALRDLREVTRERDEARALLLEAEDLARYADERGEGDAEMARAFLARLAAAQPAAARAVGCQHDGVILDSNPPKCGACGEFLSAARSAAGGEPDHG